MKQAGARGRLPPLLILILFFSRAFAQEAELLLPELTTFIPSSVERKLVLTGEELEGRHFEDLSEVLESCGIQVLSYGAYGLESKPSIRGFTDETVRVVIDGICVNNAQYGTFDFSSLNMEAVEKIEIVRGGFTEGVEDEGAVGGVVYITTKKNDLTKRFTAEFSVKTFFDMGRPLDSFFQKAAYSGRLGENTFLNTGASFNFAKNAFTYTILRDGNLPEGIFGAVEYDGLPRLVDNAQVMDGQGNVALTHYFGDGNYFSFGDLFYGGHKSTPGSVTSVGAGLQRDYNNNLTFSLWNPDLAGLFNLKNSFAWLCNNRFYRENAAGGHAGVNGSESRHFINTFKYSGTADFYSLWGGRFRQTVGLSADFTNLDSTNDGKHVQFSAVIKETSKLALGEAAGCLWSLSVPLALKFCVNDTVANVAFVPKAGVSWELERVKLTADLYRMVQFPNMDDLFWTGGGFRGNPRLKPESGWGADIGAVLQNCPVDASVTVFANYYKDKIQWGSGTTQNLSSAFYFGIDFSFGAKFMEGLFELGLNGEYLYNCLLDASNTYTYGKRIMWTPDFVCSVEFGMNFELAKIKLSADYTGKRYTSNMNLFYMKPYLLLNASVEGAAIGKWFIPFIKADNLLNWQYQSVEGYAMPGISLTFGARAKF